MKKAFKALAVFVGSALLEAILAKVFADVSFTATLAWWGAFLRACWHELRAPWAVPFWALAILVLLAMLTVSQVIEAIRKPPPPTFRDYQHDVFDGLVWRWNYGVNGIYNLVARCPTCEQVLVRREDARYAMGGRQFVTIYSCEHCNADKATLVGEPEQITSRILRCIDRKIQNGEWLNAPRVRESLAERPADQS